MQSTDPKPVIPLDGEILPWQSSDEVDMGKRFRGETDGMTFEVKLDEGLFRHLFFQGNDFYSFEVLTYPGKLVVSGGMGTFVFSRTPDMLRDFFKSGYVNTSYWEEKVIASPDGTRRFDHDAFTRVALEGFWSWSREEQDNRRVAEIWDKVKWELLDDWNDIMTEQDARTAFADFRADYDVDLDHNGEASLTPYTAQFLWSAHAALLAAQTYRHYVRQN